MSSEALNALQRKIANDSWNSLLTPSPLNDVRKPSLFDVPPAFGGTTYDAKRDEKRLTGQLAAVFLYLCQHDWVTLRELADAVNGSEAGVSARLRDLRKPAFGGHRIDTKRVTDGLWQYRLDTEKRA